VADGRGALAGLERVADALAVSPRDPVALLERTRLLVARAEATQTTGHREAAATDLGRRLAADPLDPRLWELAVRLARLEGDGAAAAEARAQVERLDPARRR
jgi:predicted Zn-dependent protease